MSAPAAAMDSSEMDVEDKAKTAKVQAFDLSEGCELRIEWTHAGIERSPGATSTAGAGETSHKCFIKLVKGTAEVFGTELAVDQKVDVYGQNVACFTFHGASVELHTDRDSVPPMVYTVGADETPMVQYANIHAALEKKRSEGKGSPSGGTAGGGEGSSGAAPGGPRCLIAGPVDMGKSTLTRILTNYAVRAGNTPVLVDLDMGQSMITVPGTISAVLVEVSPALAWLDPECLASTSGALSLSLFLSLCVFFASLEMSLFNGKRLIV